MKTRIVTFHAFRPGTGKTTLLTNTAVCAAYQGWRTGIIDADLNSPAVHHFLNISPVNYNLNQFLWGNCTMRQASYAVPLEDAPGELFLLPASDHPRDLMRAGRMAYHETFLHTAVEEFIEQNELDLLLVELHAGLSTSMLPARSLSDLFLLVLRLDEQDYQGSSIIVALAERLGIELGLVVNMMASPYDGAQVKTAVGQAYARRVWAAVPYSEDVAVLSSRDVLACHAPSHAMVQLYRALMLDIMDKP